MTSRSASRVICRCGVSVLTENWENHRQRRDGRPHYPSGTAREAQLTETLEDLLAQLDHVRDGDLMEYEIQKARVVLGKR